MREERRSGWSAVPIGIVGLALSAAGAFVSITLGVLVLGYGCGGSDVSAPTDARLCNTAAETPLGITMIVLAIGGPLYGTIAATYHRSWRHLGLGVMAGLIGIVLFLVAFSIE